MSQFFKDLLPTTHWSGSCQGYRAGWPSCAQGDRSLCLWFLSPCVWERSTFHEQSSRVPRLPTAMWLVSLTLHPLTQYSPCASSCHSFNFVSFFLVCSWFLFLLMLLRFCSPEWHLRYFCAWASALTRCTYKRGWGKTRFIRFLKIDAIFMCLSCILLDLNEISAEPYKPVIYICHYAMVQYPL